MSKKSKVTPKLDLVFKKIFGNVKNTDILADFLATVLGIETNEITNIEILDNEMIPETLISKFSRLDLKLTLNSKTSVNIEIQVLNYSNYKERTLFYWAKVYTEELQKNEDYINLKNVIAINVIDFNLFDCKEYHSTFKIFEEHRQELLTDKLRIDFLELKKAKKERGIMTDKKQMWMDFLNSNAEDDETLDSLATKSPVMEKAVAVLRQMSADEKELYEIEQREKAVRDEIAARSYEREQGLKQGEILGKVKSVIDLIHNNISKEQALIMLKVDEKTFNEVVALNGLM
ncbi:MAG: Rpn family recombination-promoting nuclease/putative transposase [Prevotella sp.]|nr:Rpn family recombination-promoting nuclease/putative transposase [Alistipes senegalensis]MCM1357711.1 Rpn family recombination-promoting nuclease/putative transposase [Prevotella sp.]MCM1474367.1 Rpn family recombination-promoting nuclease/putative transposase [Muribaculaceae bacterium]